MSLKKMKMPRLLLVAAFAGLLNSTALLAQPPVAAPRIVVNVGGHTGGIQDLTFTADGQRLVTTARDQSLRVWDLSTGASERVLRVRSSKWNIGTNFMSAISPDGELFATVGLGPDGQNNAMHVMTIGSGELKSTLTGTESPIDRIEFSPDGSTLASASRDKTARWWDLETNETKSIFKGHEGAINSINFSSDGKQLATASTDGTARIWDLLSGQQMHRLDHPGRNCLSVEFFPNSGRVTTSLDGEISFWNAAGKLNRRTPVWGTPWHTQFIGNSNRLLFAGGLGLLDANTGTTTAITSEDMSGVAVSPNGKTIATGTESGDIYLWNAEDGKQIRRLGRAISPIRNVAWSSDGQKVFWDFGRLGAPAKSFSFSDLNYSAGGRPTDIVKGATVFGATALKQTDSSTVSVLKNGQEATTLVVPSLDAENVRATCFCIVDEQTAVVGNSNGQLFLFDTTTGKIKREFSGHSGEVNDVAASPNGQYFVSGSNDHTVRIWRTDDGDPLLNFVQADDDWMAWTPEGFFAASPTGERLAAWQVDRSDSQISETFSLHQFRDRYYRPLVIANLLEFGSVKTAIETAGTASSLQTTYSDLRQPKTFSDLAPPTVKIDQPESDVQTSLETLKVHAVVQSTGELGIHSVLFLINGRPQQIRLPEDHQEWEGTVELKLVPGRNQITAVATNGVAFSESKPRTAYRVAKTTMSKDVEPIPNVPPSERQSMKDLYVLAVGISDYKDKKLRLEFAHKDADKFIESCKGQKEYYENVHTKLLINDEATEKAIEDGIDEIVKSAKLEDVVILMFSAHGLHDMQNNYYLSTHEVDRNRLRSTAIPWTDITRAIEDTRANRVVVFVDTCHSGGVTGARSMEKDPIRPLMGVQVGAIVFASSTVDKPSMESVLWGHGAFTKAVLDTLHDSASERSLPFDRRLSVSELDLNIEERVKQLTNSGQIPVTHKPLTIPNFDLAEIIAPNDR